MLHLLIVNLHKLFELCNLARCFFSLVPPWGQHLPFCLIDKNVRTTNLSNFSKTLFHWCATNIQWTCYRLYPHHWQIKWINCHCDYLLLYAHEFSYFFYSKSIHFTFHFMDFLFFIWTYLICVIRFPNLKGKFTFTDYFSWWGESTENILKLTLWKIKYNIN